MRNRRRTFEGMENVEGNRSVLLKAFGDLRKQGLIARANFRCCQTCAGYEIAEKVSNMSKEESGKVMGIVYWHNQDEDNLKECGSLYLAYGNLDTTGHGSVGLPTVEVGKIVAETLRKYGLTVEWDGSEGTRIWVDLTKPIPKEIKEWPSAFLPPDGLGVPGAQIMAEEKKKDREVLKMTDWDANAFSVMGHTKKALKEAGVESAKISSVIENATKGDYSSLLSVCVGALKEAGYEVR